MGFNVGVACCYHASWHPVLSTARCMGKPEGVEEKKKMYAKLIVRLMQGGRTSAAVQPVSAKGEPTQYTQAGMYSQRLKANVKGEALN